MVEDIIAKAQTGTNRLKPLTTNESQKQSFGQHHSKTLSNPQKRGKNYNRIAWSLKKTLCLALLLLKFKSLSVNIDKPNKGGSSGPCSHCGLCGNHGQHRNSMLMPATIIKTDNEVITLKQNLTCQNYGIDAAECTICNAKYIGQTKTKFSTSVASSQN